MSGSVKKNIDWQLVERKMEAGCSAREIAVACRIHIDTFYDRFKEYFGKGFADISDDYSQCGEGNIKYTQYAKALGGNIQMLMHLGKVRIGQKEATEDKTIEKPPNQELIEEHHRNLSLEAQVSIMRQQIDELSKIINASKSETSAELPPSEQTI